MSLGASAQCLMTRIDPHTHWRITKHMTKGRICPAPHGRTHCPERIRSAKHLSRIWHTAHPLERLTHDLPVRLHKSICGPSPWANQCLLTLAAVYSIYKLGSPASKFDTLHGFTSFMARPTPPSKTRFKTFHIPYEALTT